MKIRFFTALAVVVGMAACADGTTPTQPGTSAESVSGAVGSTSDPTYVLTSTGWGSKQSAAVAAAGGTLVLGHAGAGVGVATSSAPTFLKKVLASGAFAGASLDSVVQWQEPSSEVILDEDAVTQLAG